MKTMTMIAMALVVGISPCMAQDEAELKRSVQTKLDTFKVSLDFTATALEDVVAYVREASGLNFHIDSDVQNVPAEQLKITIKVKDLPLRSAFKLMLGKNLALTYREGVLVIKQRKEAEKMTTQLYDVRDLLLPIKDFAGPVMELDKKQPGIIVDCFLDETPKGISSAEVITDLVKSSCGGRSWDESGASISLANGLLVVSQSAAAHKEIAHLLNQLRALK